MSIDTPTQSGKPRAREKNFQKEEFFAAITKAAHNAGKKFDVPVNIDIDERGSRPRISVTAIPTDEKSEPGIKAQRRYP